MTPIVITPPAAVVTLDEACQHLRVEHTDDNAYITALIATATGWIDGPQGWLGRSLGEQTLEARFCAFADTIALPCPPVVQIVSVKYDDALGAEQTLDPAGYRLIGSQDSPRLALAYGASWPSVRYWDEAIRIRYVAGYPDGIPAPVKHAILLMIGHLYANRESVTMTTTKPEALPMGVDALLGPYRIWS